MKPPDGFKWVRVGQWLRSNDAFFSEVEGVWTPRWYAHISNYTLKPLKCTRPKTCIRNTP